MFMLKCYESTEALIQPNIIITSYKQIGFWIQQSPLHLLQIYWTSSLLFSDGFVSYCTTVSYCKLVTQTLWVLQIKMLLQYEQIYAVSDMLWYSSKNRTFGRQSTISDVKTINVFKVNQYSPHDRNMLKLQCTKVLKTRTNKQGHFWASTELMIKSVLQRTTINAKYTTI